MGERVKIAEEQAHSLTKKKLETEEEIRRVRASAVRVCTSTLCMYLCVFGYEAFMQCVWNYCTVISSTFFQTTMLPHLNWSQCKVQCILNSSVDGCTRK